MVLTVSVADAGLVAAARNGDEGAFDSLVGPLLEPGFKLAVVLLHDPDEARDAVQEATIKAWCGLRGLRDESTVRRWFFAIVANQCRSMRRQRWWSVIRAGAMPRQSEAFDGREAELDLGRSLRALPETDRAALFLFFYMDLPLADVGRVLGISPQAAKSRVHRAVERLRLGMVEVPE